ncbi:hypothetical protein ACWDOP_17210 [Nocardia sp. NPDC003693]
MTPSLAQRVDLLFRALHSPEEGEPSTELVAAALRDRGVDGTAATLDALRAGTLVDPPAALLEGLAEHFNQAAWFLLEPGESARVADTYVQLDLLRTLREAGVHRVRLRGQPATSDRRALTAALRARLRRGERP